MEYSDIVIKGTGCALPNLIFTNEDMVKWHGKKDSAWIYDRIGVQKRHSFYNYLNDSFLETDEDDLAVEASNEAIKNAKLCIKDIDAILLSTSAPTHQIYPDSSCTLHGRLGARPDSPAVTLTTGCAGILVCMMIATNLIKGGQASNVLICGASSMSSYFRPHLIDKIWLHSSIFGDGVSSIVIGKENNGHSDKKGFSQFFMGSDRDKDVAIKHWGGSIGPLCPKNIDFLLNDILDIKFRKVPDNLREKFSYVYESVFKSVDLTRDKMDWLLFNMSNAVLQKRWINEVGIEEKKVFFNMENLGNCAAASLGLAIHDFLNLKSPKTDDIALIMAVGTGLQYGGVFYKF